MKANKLLILLMSLMVLVACTDLPDNPPDEDPTGQNATQQGDYLVFREYTKVDGPLPDAPEREMQFNFKDTIYAVRSQDFLSQVAVKNDPQESVTGFYFAVSGSEGDYYYDVPLTPWMSIDSIFSAEIGVYAPADAGVTFPFSTEIYIVPYGENGPMKRTIGIVVAEEPVVSPEKKEPLIPADIANIVKTDDDEFWDWDFSKTWAYGYGPLSMHEAMIIQLPRHRQQYERFNWGYAPDVELDGCCTPDGQSHTVGAHMGQWGECIKYTRADGSVYVNPYLTTLPYNNQYVRLFDVIEFPFGGATFRRETGSQTWNVDPSKSNFCVGVASYHYTDAQQQSYGDYTFDPATRKITFNTMGSTGSGWPMPSGEIELVSVHHLSILLGNEELTRVKYRKVTHKEKRGRATYYWHKDFDFSTRP